MKRILLYGLSILLSAAVLLAAAQAIHRTFVNSWNEKQFEEFAARAATRMDLAIDLAVIAMSELSAAGELACTAEGEAAIRDTVFASSAIKDIFIMTGGKACRAFAESDLMLETAVANKPRYGARNAQISLFSMTDNSGHPVLGVVWTLAQDSEAIAIVSTDALLFDILPAAVRDFADMRIDLGASTVVASYEPSTGRLADEDVVERYRAASARYPLTSLLRVNRNATSGWNRERPLFVDIAAIIGAIIVGSLIGKLLSRPPSLAGDLKNAIRSGEIKPYFQPIISLGSNEIVGCELLARWLRRDGTMVSPAEFIPLAENSGLIDGVMEAILTDAGPQLAGLIAERPSLKVSFNVTPRQFLSEGFVTRLGALILQSGLSRARLVVEVTERQQIEDMARARTVAAELREQGIHVAIDDAGTGHNGLSAIQTLGASCVKIDKLFVDGVVTDHRTRTLVEMLVTVAREFGMTTVAEGIEDTEQVAVLKALGVQEGQGFLISRPVPAAEFREQVNRSSLAGKVVALEGGRLPNAPDRSGAPMRLSGWR
ncbi:EAL domain-containing protein [Rhizobiales bacterium]|uniref:EAL domain-containing protein n=1 Tax=Hongsoonwoonella zoysiae TaxID=2821844 RepID=UPI001561201D|nr:EAL domain-containing protein [Hongsoonwoonella zoysiae]NRG17640.1 EAL domain-containing protein [Hongsoonwoonella zoysiae]